VKIGVQDSVGTWRAWAAVWAGFTTLALFLAAGNSLTYVADGRPGSWNLTIPLELSEWWLWAALTPLVVWLSRRWPIERLGRPRPILIHLAAGLPVAFLKTAIDRELRGWIAGFTPYFLISTVTFQFMIYWVIVAVAHAVEGQRRGREREREASQLETRLAEARLELLRAQLHPHFLFNTLNAIAELIHENPVAADRMITGLGELLRQAADSAERIELAEELQLVRRYIEIQQGRFGDRVQLVVEVDVEAERTMVPSLVLQPIVENAFRHGLAPDRDGQITIRARRQNGRVLIEVLDNGVGLPAAGLEEGLGLANTRARLEATYGRGYRFEVAGADDGGVCVTIDVPFESEATA